MKKFKEEQIRLMMHKKKKKGPVNDYEREIAILEDEVLTLKARIKELETQTGDIWKTDYTITTPNPYALATDSVPLYYAPPPGTLRGFGDAIEAQESREDLRGRQERMARQIAEQQAAMAQPVMQPRRGLAELTNEAAAGSGQMVWDPIRTWTEE